MRITLTYHRNVRASNPSGQFIMIYSLSILMLGSVIGCWLLLRVNEVSREV